MSNRLRLQILLLALLPLLGADLHVWVDGSGATHVTDDPATIPPGATRTQANAVGELRALWEDGTSGPLLVTPPGSTSSETDRNLRALRGAVDDLRRGETARASLALYDVLRSEPNRPEAHWYLALLEGRRGRLDTAEIHLQRFLATAGEDFEPWRASARRRLERLADERRLMASPDAAALRLVALAHSDFRIQADAALVAAGSAHFAETVARYLGDARVTVGALLGSTTAEPTRVILYGKPSYRRTHGPRFSFQTVGFFDGRIHVVSAAHPSGELRTLLLHEYTHAVFRDRAGSDRPFWLNEGLAELAERVSDGRDRLTGGERNELRRAIEGGRWIPLVTLAPSFSGLHNGAARLAYLQSTAVAVWLEARTRPADRARLLENLGRGWGDDAALRDAVGLDTLGIDAAVRGDLLGRL